MKLDKGRSTEVLLSLQRHNLNPTGKTDVSSQNTLRADMQKPGSKSSTGSFTQNGDVRMSLVRLGYAASVLSSQATLW